MRFTLQPLNEVPCLSLLLLQAWPGLAPLTPSRKHPNFEKFVKLVKLVKFVVPSVSVHAQDRAAVSSEC